MIGGPGRDEAQDPATATEAPSSPSQTRLLLPGYSPFQHLSDQVRYEGHRPDLPVLISIYQATYGVKQSV